MTEPPVKPIKAYRSNEFLNSGHARHIRILCEYEETMQRLRAQQVRATIMFFGSARAKSQKQHQQLLEQEMKNLKEATPGSTQEETAKAAIAKLQASKWMCPILDKVRELAKAVTKWSVNHAKDQMRMVTGVSRESKMKRNASLMSATSSHQDMLNGSVHKDLNRESKIRRNGSLMSATSSNQDMLYESMSDVELETLPLYLPHSTDDVPPERTVAVQPVFVCTGGGPGFMEAANKGASEVKSGKSIGMGITLPFEAGLNPFVTHELAFEFHYFFTRKFWMAFHMQALVVAPGGFGTLDELFEILTLKQTGKIQKWLPIVLFGRDYWNEIVNWKSLVKYGVVLQEDIDQLLFTDDVEEALNFITAGLQHVTEASLAATYGE